MLEIGQKVLLVGGKYDFLEEIYLLELLQHPLHVEFFINSLRGLTEELLLFGELVAAEPPATPLKHEGYSISRSKHESPQGLKVLKVFLKAQLAHLIFGHTLILFEARHNFIQLMFVGSELLLYFLPFRAEGVQAVEVHIADEGREEEVLLEAGGPHYQTEHSEHDRHYASRVRKRVDERKHLPLVMLLLV